MKSSIPIYDLSTFEQYKNQGVYIGQFGAYSKRYKHLHSAHGHSFYHMVYFTKGQGVQHIDFKPFEIKPRQVYFMIPGQVHSWSFSTEPDGYIVNFSKDYFSSLLLKANYVEDFPFFKGVVDQQVAALDQDTAVKVTHLFEEMLKEGFNLGGEQSGHVILLDYNPTGDGILASLMLIRTLIENKQKASEARKIVSIFPQVLVNAKVRNG